MIDIAQLIQDVIDEKENPLKAFAVLKGLQKQIADGIKEIEEGALEEAAKYGEKTFEAMNFKFEVREGRRTYSFKNIESWVETNNKLKEMESTFKQAASAYEKGKTVVDDNGEVVPVPEVTYSKSSITVKPLS